MKEKAAADSAIRDYTLVAGMSLLFVGLLLANEGYDYWALLPPLLGGVGLLVPWGFGPTLVLVSVAFVLALPYLIMGPYFRRFAAPPDALFTMTLALACFAVVTTLSRLRQLKRFPMSEVGDKKPPKSPQKAVADYLAPRAVGRSPDRVRSIEMVWLIGMGIALTAVAFVVWGGLSQTSFFERADVGPWVWHAILLLWAAGMVLICQWVMLSYFGWVRAGHEECALFLQDQLWTATRLEQRRQARWWGAANLKKQQREEKQ
jgi:hypothetical protein